MQCWYENRPYNWEIYNDCRNVCTFWIWNPELTPNLGGYGKIVEMDKSFFPGAPKFNRGRRVGTSWEGNEKWTEVENLFYQS